MILYPKDKPVITDLNSYYVDVARMLEHYQGRMTAGAVHFKAPALEGVLFFDENEPLTGIVDARDGSLYGPPAVDQLLAAADRYNCTLGVFEVPPEKAFFWTRLPEAQPIYDNLSAEFADLSALVQKMKVEHLTGFIDVKIPAAPDSSMILFENGTVVDVAGPGLDDAAPEVGPRLDALIEEARQNGGSFSVRQIPIDAAAAPEAAAHQDDGRDAVDVSVLEELMDIFARAVASQGRDFQSLFRRKCIDNAERFDFLDPFVGEFQYVDSKISYSGDVGYEALLRGLITTLRELAEELNISTQVRHALNSWSKRWEAVLKRHDIAL